MSKDVGVPTPPRPPTAQCVYCTVFSSRPNEVEHVEQSNNCNTIQHIFVHSLPQEAGDKTLATLFQRVPLEPGCPTGNESKQLSQSFSMLGPAGERPPFTWIPVKEDALSPSQPTLATQVLFSFPPLLQLLPSYDTVEEQTRSATGSVLLLTRQLNK